MLETLQNAVDWAAPHWPGLSWATIAMIVGQVMAHRVFTKTQAAKKRKSQWFWWWGRKTLPLHPVAAGFILGVFWQDPVVAQDWPWIASPMYFAFFGAISCWMYETIKGLAKKKGIELGPLPGASEPPAAK